MDTIQKKILHIEDDCIVCSLHLENNDGRCEIIADVIGHELYICDMDSYPPRKRLGSKLLHVLQDKYDIIVYSSSTEAAPFWKKMLERGVIKNVIKKRGVLLE